MRFRLVWYITQDDNKYDSQDRYEFFGDRHSIYNLWFVLKRTLKNKHVDVFSLDGKQQEPENGFPGMIDYNP